MENWCQETIKQSEDLLLSSPSTLSFLTISRLRGLLTLASVEACTATLPIMTRLTSWSWPLQRELSTKYHSGLFSFNLFINSTFNIYIITSDISEMYITLSLSLLNLKLIGHVDVWNVQTRRTSCQVTNYFYIRELRGTLYLASGSFSKM